ncbi:hypothetical protein GE253_09515 [Niveispirillum sp. SYP-B3756]|uniref:hypothetical protein n=1 Tax=Niveispirillum sp. SYP-B3756 TaxID=2662178 RepID=UPI001291FA5D|nr:hypothetical protein [Niveispirillum sp. SYP-B3756]MQP65583.1 hypothetical protein [Niveispirillum sp. SYP-B3756]
MRTLKLLLILGALVIAAGFAFLGYEVYKRSTDPDHPRKFSERFGTKQPAPDATSPNPNPAAPPTKAGEPVAVGPLTATPLALPAGAELLPGLASIGGRIALQVRQPDGRVQVLLVDPRDGTSHLLVTTTPASP